MVLDESKKIVIFGRVRTTLEELENTVLSTVCSNQSRKWSFLENTFQQTGSI